MVLRRNGAVRGDAWKLQINIQREFLIPLFHLRTDSQTLELLRLGVERVRT